VFDVQPLPTNASKAASVFGNYNVPLPQNAPPKVLPLAHYATVTHFRDVLFVFGTSILNWTGRNLLLALDDWL
jgi:hypothetical protein